MTERERFEAWFNDFHIEEHPQYQTIRDFAFAAWQAALNGRGDPVAGVIINKSEEDVWPQFYYLDKFWDLPIGDHFLFTAPPNTYTEKEVDEMMMKVAMEVCDFFGNSPTKYGKEQIRAIVDKVKAG